MSTLKELLGADWKPKEFKVRMRDWDKREYFVPYFEVSSLYHGIDDKGNYLNMGNDSSGWELFKEKKTVKYLAYENDDGRLNFALEKSHYSEELNFRMNNTRIPELDMEVER